MHTQRLGDDVLHAPARVQTGVGVLENHLHAPTQGLGIRTGQGLRQIVTVKEGIDQTLAKKLVKEIKDAKLIFETVWNDLVEDVGRDHLRFPKEIILLGGAPGAGKGTNTEFIARARGLTCPPIVMSALLDSPEARKLKDAGKTAAEAQAASNTIKETLRKDERIAHYIGQFIDAQVEKAWTELGGAAFPPKQKAQAEPVKLKASALAAR